MVVSRIFYVESFCFLWLVEICSIDGVVLQFFYRYMIFPDLRRFPNLTNNKMQTITLFSSETANTHAREDATFLRMPINACSKCQFLEIYCRYRTAKWMDGFLSFLHVSPILYPKAENHGFNEDCNPYDGHQFFIFGNGNGITSEQCGASWAPWHSCVWKHLDRRNGGMVFLKTLSGHQNRLRKHPQGWTWPFFKGRSVTS